MAGLKKINKFEILNNSSDERSKFQNKLKRHQSKSSMQETCRGGDNVYHPHLVDQQRCRKLGGVKHALCARGTNQPQADDQRGWKTWTWYSAKQSTTDGREREDLIGPDGNVFVRS